MKVSENTERWVICIQGQWCNLEGTNLEIDWTSTSRIRKLLSTSHGARWGGACLQERPATANLAPSHSTRSTDQAIICAIDAKPDHIDTVHLRSLTVALDFILEDVILKKDVVPLASVIAPNWEHWEPWNRWGYPLISSLRNPWDDVLWTNEGAEAEDDGGLQQGSQAPFFTGKGMVITTNISYVRTPQVTWHPID